MSLPQSSGVSPDDIATAPTDNLSPGTGIVNSELSPEEQERLEKIRAQFDRAPYPRYPLDGKPSALKRHVHCLRTAYHRRYQKLTETTGKRILDVGCGSGFGTLALALANPDTTIVGVDLSAASLDLAQKRIEHHGLEDRCRFEKLSLEQLDQLLPDQFDFINCDELLYLQPDPSVGLRAMKKALAADGIIRTNLHSQLQRMPFFRAQALAHLMGLMDGNPDDMEVSVFRELFESLKDSTQLKKTTWVPDKADEDAYYMMNYLFQGDRGFTIPDMFSALERSELSWISMADWQSWVIEDLFKDPEDMPAFFAMGLSMASDVEKLQIHDLLMSSHRLLDFWCGHPEADQDWLPVEDWEPEDWQTARVALTPQLNTEQFKEGLGDAVTEFRDLQMRRFFDVSWGLQKVSGAIAIGLLPLLDGPKDFAELVSHWQTVCPVDPVSLTPTTPEQAAAPLRYLLTELAKWGYVLPECAAP